jgi:hypothetical protein
VLILSSLTHIKITHRGLVRQMFAMRNRSRQHRIGAALLAGPILVLLAFMSDRLVAQTPAEAFKRGCGGGCHASDATIVRRIRKEPEAERRAWIESFMTLHPCASDDLKPVIVDYLLERSRP